MQTARHAICAARLFWSASETATTVSIPSRLHARTMRTAISPRFATSRRAIPDIDVATLLGGRNHDQHLIELNHRSILHQDARHDPVHAGLDGAEQLHHFDQADGIVRLHALADLDERRFTRGRRAIKRAEHGRPDRNLSFSKRRLDGELCGGGRRAGWGHRLWRRRRDRPLLGRCRPCGTAADVQPKSSMDQLELLEMLRRIDDLQNLFYVFMAQFHGTSRLNRPSLNSQLRWPRRETGSDQNIARP